MLQSNVTFPLRMLNKPVSGFIRSAIGYFLMASNLNASNEPQDQLGEKNSNK